MKDWLKDIIIPVVSVIAALLAAWVSYSVADVKTALDQQKLQLDQQKSNLDTLTAERAMKKFDEDLAFKVYEAVSAALKAHDLQQQQAASAMVMSLIEEPLRTQLLHVFDSSEATAAPVKNNIQRVLRVEEQFHQDEAVVKAVQTKMTVASGWTDWDVDVFWCGASGAGAKAQSESLVAALKAAGAKGRVRSRVLPDSINAQAGYRVHGFLIRPDVGDGPEAERATALQQLAKTLNMTFDIGAGRSSTRWYLSAFICP